MLLQWFYPLVQKSPKYVGDPKHHLSPDASPSGLFSVGWVSGLPGAMGTGTRRKPPQGPEEAPAAWSKSPVRVWPTPHLGTLLNHRRHFLPCRLFLHTHLKSSPVAWTDLSNAYFLFANGMFNSSCLFAPRGWELSVHSSSLGALTEGFYLCSSKGRQTKMSHFKHYFDFEMIAHSQKSYR